MANTRRRRNAGGRMTKRRTQFEAQTPERFTTAQEIIPGARNLSNSQLSRAMGWYGSDNAPGSVNPRQGTLFEHPHQIDNPPQWEDMAPEAQSRTLAAAADFGVTPETMKRSFSAQLQRGLIRDPNHASFYEDTGKTESGEYLPKGRLVASSEETGTPLHVNAMANAITSPQMHFIQKTKRGIQYPNDETAKGAILYSQAGMTGKDYIEGFTSKEKGGAGYPLQGYPANVAKAIDAVTKVSEGATVREAWTPSSGPGEGGSDKTRPYHNALVTPHTPEGNFLVSDTHTGAGGMAPHLAGTEHENAYLRIPGIHALHDHIARQVAQEHGLGSVSRVQSLQWNQEKMESNATSMAGAASVEHMQPAANRNVNQRQQEITGQRELF